MKCFVSVFFLLLQLYVSLFYTKMKTPLIPHYSLLYSQHLHNISGFLWHKGLSSSFLSLFFHYDFPTGNWKFPYWKIRVPYWNCFHKLAGYDGILSTVPSVGRELLSEAKLDIKTASYKSKFYLSEISQFSSLCLLACTFRYHSASFPGW